MNHRYSQMQPHSPKKLTLLSFIFALTSMASPLFAAPQQGPMPVPVIKVEPANPVFQTTHSARLSAIQDVEVHARITANIEKKHFVEGSAVKAGQILYTLDDSRVRANYEVAKAAVETAKVRLQQAKVTYTRTKGLGHNVSAQDIDDSYAAWKAAQSDLNAAEASLLSAEIELNDATIRAKIDGFTGETLQNVCDLVNPNTNSLLTTITQTDQLYALFTISDADREKRLDLIQQQLLELKPTATVELLDPAGNVVAEGVMNYVAPKIETATAGQISRALFNNENQRFLPGQFMNVRVSYGNWKNVYAIPKVAIVQNGPQAFVYVIEEGKAQMTPVTIVGQSKDNWLISKGVETGNQIITGNLIKVRPNAPVQAMPESSDSKNTK